MPVRTVAIGAGLTAVGAAVLVGASASGTPGTVAMAAVTTPASVTVVDGPQIAAVLPADGKTLAGFTPPAQSSSAPAPQFRIAANLPTGPLGIPGIVLQAYKLGAKRVAAESPQCKLPWFLLAGIGRIESGHAGGGNVDDYGNTRTSIRGPVLDGSLAGNAVIRDSDGGKLDGDLGHDRAMGPMQFIPSTWAAWGSDANGDGKANPDNVFDAAYSAGRYLCAGVTDIMNDSHKVASVLRYNRSVAYANNVLAWAAAYATGAVPIGGIPEMGASGPEKTDAKKKDDKKKKKDQSSKSAPPSSGAPVPDKPSTTAPPKTCLGVVCLPPGLGPPLPGPQQKAPAPPKNTAPPAKKPTGRPAVTPR